MQQNKETNFEHIHVGREDVEPAPYCQRLTRSRILLLDKNLQQMLERVALRDARFI